MQIKDNYEYADVDVVDSDGWGGLNPKSGGRRLDGYEWNDMPATFEEEIEYQTNVDRWWLK